MQNQITRAISLCELFTCVKFQSDLKKWARIMSLFQKSAKNDDFKNGIHF